ncbi:hypothetical protein CDEF62S_04395 [Castellaniella defragrans]
MAEAIGAVSSGTINVLPPDAVKYNADGGISNVSAGQAGTDAVNVQQMNQAIANNSVKYFSIDPNSDPGNKANNGASGANSMAIGPVASAQGESALALGHNATVEADRSTAIGYTVGAYADNATVVGSNSNVYDQGGVAVGQNATSHGTNSIAMGTGALTETKGTSSSVDNAVAIGTNAWSTANSAVAVGQSSRAAGVKSIAQGFEAQATAESSQAFGTGSSASAQNAQASGTGANASGASSQARGTGASASATNAQASGTNASSYATDGIAVGTNARSGIANPLTPEDAAKNVNGIAIGNTAVADDVNAMAVGVNAGAHAQSAAAFGDGSSATGQKSLAVGSGASASQASAAALGDGSTATGEKSLAVGSGANASAASAAALGAGAQALTARSVALGDGAVTAGAVGTSSTVVDKVTYNFAGTNPVGTVSIGTDTDKRTLTNVAAGRVSGTSTDAINGSQLYGTNLAVTQLGNDLDTAGQSVAGALGGDSKYNPATHQVTANLAVNGNTYNNVQDALSYVGQGWNLTANGANGAAVKPGDSVDLSSAADNNIVLTKSSAANSQQVKFGLADNVNVKNNLTVGGNTTVAGNTTVTGTTTLNGGATISKTLTVNPNTTVNFGGNKITNVAAGSADTDAVNVSQLNQQGTDLTQKGLNFAGDTGTDVHRDLGQKLNIVGGQTDAAKLTDGNIGVVADGTDKLSIKLAQNLNLGSSGSVVIGDSALNNGGLTVDDGAGNSTKTTVAGTTVTDSAGNETSTTATGTTVTDGTNTTSLTATQVVVGQGGANPVTINGATGTVNGLTNKTFDPDHFTSGQAATEDQLKQVSSNIATAGLDFAGDTGTDVHRDLGQKLNIVGGQTDAAKLTDGNIGVVADGTDKLSIKLAQNLNLGSSGSVVIGDSTLNNDGLTVDDGAGNTTSTTATGTTVTDGVGNATSTTATGTTVTGAAGTTTVAAGNVSVSDGTNSTNLTSTQVVVGQGGANPVTINGATGTVNGLTNKTFDPDHFTSGQAATEDQLKQVSGDITTAGLDFAGDTGTDVHRDLGQKLNIVGGQTDAAKLTDGNIGVVADGTDKLSIKLAQNLNLGSSGSVVIGDSTLNNDGLTVDDGAGNTTTVAASNVSVSDGTNTTTLAPTQIQVGGANPVAINGAAGTVNGLTNTIFNPGHIVSGQAATEDQLGMIGNTLNLGLSGDGKSNVINYNGQQYSSLSDVLDSLHWNVDASGPSSGSGSGSGAGGAGGSGGGSGSGGAGGAGGGAATGPTEIHNGNTVTFVAGDNITVGKTPSASGSGDASITIGMAQDIKVNSVTANNVQANTVNAKAVIIQDGPTINQNGIDMNNKRITNVAPGVDGTDAVNVNQLNNLANNVTNGMNAMQNEINRNDRIASAGIAAAIATAGLPQAYLPGKSMVSIGGGTWRGESGYALGLSRVTDNGNWVVKATASGSSRGDYGGSVGVGYQW